MSAAVEIDAVPGALRTAAAAAPVVQLQVTAELALRIARRVEDGGKASSAIMVARLMAEEAAARADRAASRAAGCYLIGWVCGIAMGIFLVVVLT